MPEFTYYQLEPPPSQQHMVLHIGKRGIGIEETAEYVPSDSLFAALVAQAALLEGVVDAPPQFAQKFLGDEPPLLHSSVFPRLGDVLLLPRPALELRMDDQSKREAVGKGFKKLRYLSPKLFKRVCTHHDLSGEPIIKLQHGSVWISESEVAALPNEWHKTSHETDLQWQSRISSLPVWQIEQIPHVAVDRVTNTSAYYEVGRTTFAAGCGLGLVVDYRDQSIRPQFEYLLTLLGEAGLGGKRSSGYGGFNLRKESHIFAFDDLPKAEVVLTLSRYIPRPDEVPLLQDQHASYNITAVEGWLLSPSIAPQRRQRINCLTEGSIVARGATPPLGRIVDVHPQLATDAAHPVLRSGLALTIPIERSQTNAT